MMRPFNIKNQSSIPQTQAALCDLSILILAGGQSSRMGQDKALMYWEGVPLLTRVCTIAQTISQSVHILSPWPQRYEAIVPPKVDRHLETNPGYGPLWALYEGLNYIHSPWILLLACDMPQLDSSRIQAWRSRLSSQPNRCLAYIPQTQRGSQQHPRWEPLCGFYRRSCQSSLQEFLDQGGQSFQRWLNQIEAIAIPIKAPTDPMFYNCNRPNDLIHSPPHSADSPE